MASRATPDAPRDPDVHRSAPSCRSCHDRIDPLGLALEQFNALGMWRETERGQPIDASGKLITGETVHRHPGTEGHPGPRDIAAIFTAAHREAPHLCAGAGAGGSRRGDGGPDRGTARAEQRPSVSPADGHHRFRSVSEAPGRGSETAVTGTAAATRRVVTRRSADVGRRRFLRGLGACLALPALESLRPHGWTAQPPSARWPPPRPGSPLRTAFIFFPNGAIPSRWWPTRTGRDFELSRSLRPLESVRHHIQILGGLDHKTATAGGTEAGDHARGNATFLTGVRVGRAPRIS